MTVADLHDLLARDSAAERERDSRVVYVLDAVVRLIEVIGPEPTWQVHAACRGQTEVMFPQRGGDPREAKALCASCPVFDECDAWATAEQPRHGITAGLSERGRRQRRAAA